MSFLFFFFNDTATTEIYTLSLHDALPISVRHLCRKAGAGVVGGLTGALGGALLGGILGAVLGRDRWQPDRKSTRLNSSHSQISYAVFCLKKKKYYSIPPLATTPIETVTQS